MPARKKLEAAAEPRIAKGPVTKSGTLSAADKKPSGLPTGAKAARDKRVAAADPADGPGLVEHGVGLGRHRPEDGPVAADGTVILVTPERGA